MEVIVRGRHIDLSQAIVDRVEQSLAETSEKYFGNALSASVVIGKEGLDFKSTVSVHVHKGLEMQSESVGKDAYQAFDAAATKIAKRLRRHKRKLNDHHEQGRAAEAGKAQQFVLAPPADEPEDGMGGEAETGDAPLIVAESQTELLKLPVNMAVVHMDLSESQAFVFQNAKTDRVNVLYRRSDGNIGWIDPQLS